MPKPPLEELPAAVREAMAKAAEQQAQAGQAETYEMDDWIMDFARAFSELTNIDPTVTNEHINIASEKMTRAVDATLSEEKALPLFDQAAEHFRDATATSLVQWGNINVVKADRQAQHLLKAGKAVEGKALDAMLKEFDESEKK